MKYALVVMVWLSGSVQLDMTKEFTDSKTCWTAAHDLTVVNPTAGPEVLVPQMVAGCIKLEPDAKESRR